MIYDERESQGETMFPIKDNNEVYVTFSKSRGLLPIQVIRRMKINLKYYKQKFILAQSSIVFEVAINEECLWLKFKI